MISKVAPSLRDDRAELFELRLRKKHTSRDRHLKEATNRAVVKPQNTSIPRTTRKRRSKPTFDHPLHRFLTRPG